jgi:2-keto-4-pentenoate hydratase/2-oxohepta-3-ene-1,7-dioic acid hydratase in catechol pathway
MKFLTFTLPPAPRDMRLGALVNGLVIDMEAARSWAQEARGLPYEPLPDTLFELIRAGPRALGYARNLINILEGVNPPDAMDSNGRQVGTSVDHIILYPPLPRPMSVRDFYAFEEHVATANAIRGRAVPEEWYQFPVFYFSNPNSIFGPGETVPCPSFTECLDYELEVACIIGKPGRNIHPEEAEEFIFGYTIFNDWSARDVQREETKVGLGPAKAKDFASSLGPWIVTTDELQPKSTGRAGVYDLEMKARVNGQERSRGNWKDIHYSFGEMIARASAGAWLLPGDVIGSGTVGSGCLLELTRDQGPWLQPGDVVELEIEGIGVLTNRVGVEEVHR